jgi:hypothetical protein
MMRIPSEVELRAELIRALGRLVAVLEELDRASKAQAGLASALAELNETLREARRPQEAAIPPVAVRKNGVRHLLSGISSRHIDRLVASRKFPAPTFRCGKIPMWSIQSIRNWVEKGGCAG